MCENNIGNSVEIVGAGNPPLIPSLLYTQGDANVQCDEENDLKVPDPEPAKAGKIIQASIVEGVKSAAGTG